MNRVVITGVGPICALGAGQDLVSESLAEGASGILDIAAFENDQYPAHTAGTVEDFDVDEYLPTPKNYLDRNTELAFAAFYLALKDSGIDLENVTDKPALLLGTSYGGVDTINRFFTDVKKKGMRFGKPILFPHTYSNTAISLISIEYGLDGHHMNFSSGWVASSHAIINGFDLIRNGKTSIAFSGGTDAFSETLFRFCIDSKMVAIDQDGIEECKPFNETADGLNVGEGACFLTLESLESANVRKANIRAELKGSGMANQTGEWSEDNYRAITSAMTKAIDSAGLSKDEIDCIISSANGMNSTDKAELNAIKNMFSGTDVPVTTIKPLTGETFGASCAIQAATAVYSIIESAIPAITTPLEDLSEVYLVKETVKTEINNVLLNSIDPGGAVSSIIISKFDAQ